MNLNLNGKRAIVTGGSRGIGKAVIDNFVAENMQVATCARGLASLEKSLTEWNKAGTCVTGQSVDVTDEQAYANWFEQSVQQLGGLDILVSNVTTRIESKGIERWKDTFEVDLLQHIRATELALPYLKKGNQPAIVYVASIASVMTANMPSEVEYGTMKAALVSYATQLANQLGQFNIRVNLVSPGPIHHEQGFWEMVKQKQPDLYQRACAVSVFNRMGTPTEVANAITFLSSPAASNITAVNLRVDGGAIKTVNY
ncbi:SDR family NAD(P)-dependent oxidoreductase [Shewanella sp. MF05960]|uniref:SDR family NAD(P)-dependent oxidoreductase n=1 Tax=Shewanella sp. MF05960 TaxID=3434874 RepID=UPI003D7B8DF1